MYVWFQSCEVCGQQAVNTGEIVYSTESSSFFTIVYYILGYERLKPQSHKTSRIEHIGVEVEQTNCTACHIVSCICEIGRRISIAISILFVGQAVFETVYLQQKYEIVGI